MSVYGILSLIVWSLVLIVSVKYLVVMMRLDNRGEGGIRALLALGATRGGLFGSRRRGPGGDGAEALYADLGHFGRRPIRVAWFAMVLPGARPRTQHDWLLIKRRDRYASTRDITVAAPTSVLTGRTLAQIAADEGGDVAKAASGDPPKRARRR